MSAAGPRPLLGLPRPVWGTLSMALAAACFAGNHALVRASAAEIDALQISALRFLWAVPMMLPWLLHSRGGVLRTRRHGMHFLTGLVTVITTLVFFTALARLPLALATALNFTAPMFTTVIAVLVLKERVEAARWIATLVGFAGVVIILRPGAAGVDPNTLLPIASAFSVAVWYLLLKRLGSSESNATVTVYQTFWSALVLTLIALAVWQTPSWLVLFYTAAMAALGTGGIFFAAKAFEFADASLAAPFDYARLPFIAVMAYFAFGEVPGPYTIAGAAVIVGAAIFLVRRESRSRNRTPRRSG